MKLLTKHEFKTRCFNTQSLQALKICKLETFYQSINQGTGRSEGPAGNTPTVMLPVNYKVHILVYLYTIINTKLHSHENGPKPPIIIII